MTALPPSRYGARPPELVAGVETLVSRVSAGWRRPVVFTDLGVRGAGLLACVDPAWPVWDACRADPTSDDVAAAAAFASAVQPDVLVAVGGGSVIDTAKGAAFLLANAGRMEDWAGVGVAPRALLPLVVVPTTAGTGSEAQSFALISASADHKKMACGHPSAMPALVFHAPELLASCPRSVRVEAGLDALVHAVEAAVTRVRTPASAATAALAFQDLWSSIRAFVDDPSDAGVAARMQRGATLAGAAIEASMLGAAHATANPLSARFRLAHGRAVARMIGPVIRMNRAAPGYEALLDAAGLASVDGLAAAVEALVDDLGVARLRDVLPDRDALPALVPLALAQWTGGFNPVGLDADAVLELYRAAW